jgi:uncharacterized protein YggE
MRAATLVALSTLSLLFPPMTDAQTPDKTAPSTLTVSGSGETRVAPDIATVRLGVLTQSASAKAAQEQVNRVNNATLEAVAKLGVKPDQIQTSDLSLSPLYSQPKPGDESNAPRVVGYQASTVIAIRLTDLTKIGPVIDAGLAAGANRLDGVSFGLENDEAARNAALVNAVQEARAKAATIAKAFDVQLVEILEISEGGTVSAPPPYPQPRFAMAMEASADTSVSVGQIGVEASVSVRYRIAPLGGAAKP